MDETVEKMALMAAVWVANADVNMVHRGYHITVPVQVLIFFHNVVIALFVFGIFYTTPWKIRLHLAAASALVLLWFLRDGCFLTEIQKEFLKYSPEESEAIHGTWDQQVRHLVLVGTPVILYDFYKLLR